MEGGADAVLDERAGQAAGDLMGGFPAGAVGRRHKGNGSTSSWCPTRPTSTSTAPDPVDGLVSSVREMRHKGMSVPVASQDPPSVPIKLIELSDVVILHKFNSPA